MAAVIKVTYTDGSEEEYETDRYNISNDNCLFIWTDLNQGKRFEMIRINYGSTRRVVIDDQFHEPKSGQYV